MQVTDDMQEIREDVFFDLTLDRRQLLKEYPPRFQHPYKRMLYELSGVPETLGEDPMRVLRCRPVAPEAGTGLTEVQCVAHDGFYRYAAELEADRDNLHWHVNFADGDLFLAYGSHLFAQDEMQVAEHPILGSLREMLFDRSLSDSDYDPCTRDDDDRPTPVLILGAERCLAIDTAPDAASGRPEGLFGQCFSQAPEEAVRQATSRLCPPTRTHLIAMEAPKPRSGIYQRETIEDILRTAYTAFSAARRLAGSQRGTVIHTGNWGCGAYGGNLTLMYVAQMLVADWAGVERLEFYDCRRDPMREAGALLDEFRARSIGPADVVDDLEGRQFKWGVSDGN